MLTKDQVKTAKDLLQSEDLYVSEVARRFGVSANTLHYAAKSYGVILKSRKKQGQGNRVYSHMLVRRVFEYFLTHSQKETEEKFSLTTTHFRSIFTNGYKTKELSHLRKDTRVKEGWTTKEYLFMLRRCGLMSRKSIGMAMGRSKSHHAVKEKLALLGGGESRYLNGICARWADYLKTSEIPEKFLIKTKAGPPGYEHIIVPWVIFEKYTDIPHARMMAKYQRFIFSGFTDRRIINFIRRVVA